MSKSQGFSLFFLGISSMVFFALVAMEHDFSPIVIGICVIGGAVIVQFVQGMFPMAVWGGILVFAFNVTPIGSQAWFAGAVVVTISIVTLIVTRRSAGLNFAKTHIGKRKQREASKETDRVPFQDTSVKGITIHHVDVDDTKDVLSDEAADIPTADTRERLTKLKQLVDEGLLSEDEAKDKRRDILKNL